MKFFISILLCFTSIITRSQSHQPPSSNTINFVDKDSLKQGYWYEYRIVKILTTDTFNRNPRAIGFHNTEGHVEIPVAEGYYKNNKRIGVWKFYKGSFYNDNYADPTSHEQIAIFSDSNYFTIIDSFWHFEAKVSIYSSCLQGTILLKDDTIYVACKNKSCYLKGPFQKNKKRKFPLKELDNQLIWINFRNSKVKAGNHQ